MKKNLTIMFFGFLVACVPDVRELETAVTIPTKSAPTLLPVSPTPEMLNSDLSWSTAPTAVILQYDILGGLMGPGPGTHLPLWTLYGDGLVVWTEDGPPTPGFTAQVWTGHLSNADIESLLVFVDEQGFWELASSYQPEQFITSTVPAEDNSEDFSVAMPNPEAALDQPSSVIVAASSNFRHQVTVFPAEWSDAPKAYQALRQHIQTIRPADAVSYTPTSYSLRAREQTHIPVDDTQVNAWPYGTILISEVANLPLTVNKEQGVDIAEFIAANGQKVVQNGVVYLVTLMADLPRR